jgi:hypothetical protein
MATFCSARDSAGVDSANSNLTGNYVLARFDASG